ncbi:hypothetical protein [Cryptosporangium aurantiacum]|uniref:hypothetical protein n=1 Tax=Cryptosporangium aurantiacum TaxID=134849 RepID=UPI0011610C57|nr:hypothetical protein [Cryptosporangium aurantiacum]
MSIPPHLLAAEFAQLEVDVVGFDQADEPPPEQEMPAGMSRDLVPAVDDQHDLRPVSVEQAVGETVAEPEPCSLAIPTGPARYGGNDGTTHRGRFDAGGQVDSEHFVFQPNEIGQQSVESPRMSIEVQMPIVKQ